MRVQLARFLKNVPIQAIARYNTILNFSIFFCSSIIISLIFALIFEKKIEEKQLSISENLLALEYIDEWNQYINMTDLYGFSWETRYLAEKSLNDFTKEGDVTEENIIFLKECALFPFNFGIPQIYANSLHDINRIGFSIIDDEYSEEIMDAMKLTIGKIDILFEDNEIELEKFDKSINDAHLESYKHKLSINNLLAKRVNEIQLENIVNREKINHFNAISSNIVLISFLVQVFIYIIYNIFEVNTYSKYEK